MFKFRKLALAALAAALVGATAMPAFADRGGRGEGPGQGWHQAGHGKQWGENRGKHGHYGRRGQMARMFMERFDTDRDGKVTQEEIDAKADAMFTAADSDGNGSVTLDEFKIAYAEEFSERRVRAFQRLDRDGDGKVTEEEYNRRAERMLDRMERADDDDGGKHRGGRRGHAGMMERFDADGDGNVTADEVRQGRADAFAEADANGDKVLTLDEFGTIWADRVDTRMVRGFQRLDRNGDLVVTKEEAMRPLTGLVARMDRNKDGVLSIEDRPRRGMGGHHGKRWHGQRDGRGEGRRGNDNN